jgi:putative transposase
LEVEPGIAHVYARGNERKEIFRSPDDRRCYVARLGAVAVSQQWRCLSYCLMGNHVHLLLETVKPNLGDGMRLLHGGYAQEFNRRHHRAGHLFQGRYGAVRIDDDEQLATTVRYIATNPVAAGLVQRPEAWRWGSHAAVLGHAPAPAWLAVGRLFEVLTGAFGGEGEERYRALIAGRLSVPA